MPWEVRRSIEFNVSVCETGICDSPTCLVPNQDPAVTLGRVMYDIRKTERERERLTAFKLVVVKLIPEAAAPNAHDPNENDVVLAVYLDWANIPWNGTPDVGFEHIAFELGRGRHGAHPRVVEEEEDIA